MPQLLDTSLFSVIDTDSSIGVGWKLNFYLKGTTTRKDTYPTEADASAGTNPNTNPVVIDASGRLPAIWLADDADYKGVLTDDNDVVKETIVQINQPRLSAPDGSAQIGFIQAGTGAVDRTAQDKMRETVSSADYGAAIDGVTNDAVALQNLFARMAVTGRVDLGSGTYSVLQPISIPPGVIEGGDVTLDFSAANPLDFPDDICVLIQGEAKTSLPALSGDLAIGDRIFSFTGAHGLAEDDAFQLCGTVNGAGNGYQAYYRKGEMFRVARVVDSDTIETTGACRDTYPAAGVTCWKRQRSTFRNACAKLRIIGPDTINYPIRFVTLDDIGVDNIEAYGGRISSINFSDCYGIYGRDLIARQLSDSVPESGYGITLTYCQGADLSGETYGYFNGIATGGGDGDPLVANPAGMNRDIHFSGKGGSDPVDGLAGVNFHGNTEYSSYRGTFSNGAVLAGNWNEAHGTFIGKSGQPAVNFTEMHGHAFHVSGSVRTVGVDLATSTGAINMGSSGDDYGTYARYGGRTIFDVELRASNATRIVLWRTTALVRTDVVLEFRRLDLMEMNGTTRIMVLSANSGNAIPYIEFGRLNIMDTSVAITWSLDSATKLRGLVRTKAVAVTGTTVATATAAITFTPAFPRTPTYTTGMLPAASGTSPLCSGIQSGTPTASGATVQVFTTDKANQNISTSVTVTGILNEE